MNIGIDGNVLSYANGTGIVSYVNNIINNFKMIDNNLYLFMTKKNEMKLDKTMYKKNTNIIAYKQGILNKSKIDLIKFMYLSSNKYFNEYKIDSYWATNFVAPYRFSQNTKMVTTIYDLIPFKYKIETPYRFKNYLKNVATTHSIYYSDEIITISESVKNEIIEYFDLKNPEKIKIVYPSTNHFVRLSNDQLQMYKNKLLNTYNINNFILTNYTITPRKDIITIIKAYNSLSNKFQKEYALVIAGPRVNSFDDYYIKVKEEAAKNKYGKIIFTGYIDLNELVSLYNLTSLFISASIAEGFDMPVIQALCLNIPIIASDIPVHKELIMKFGFYFKTQDVNDLHDKIESLLTYKRVVGIPEMYMFKKYTWSDAANQVLDILKH